MLTGSFLMLHYFHSFLNTYIIQAFDNASKNIIFEDLSQVVLFLPVTPDFEGLSRGGVPRLGQINPCPQLAIMALPNFSLMQSKPTPREIFDHFYPFIAQACL